MQGMIPTEPQTVGIQIKSGPAWVDPRTSEIQQGYHTVYLGIGILAVGYLAKSWLLGITGIIVLAAGWSRAERWSAMPQVGENKPGPGIVVDLSTGVATLANVPKIASCADHPEICNGKI